jgi:hypothetical protein
MIEAIGFVLGIFVLVAIVLGIVYQLTWQEPVAPGFLELHELDTFLNDYEPDTRTLQERIDEQKRLLKFQGLID